MEQQPHATRRKQSRFRPLHSFSLRMLFAVTAAVAVLLGANVAVARALGISDLRFAVLPVANWLIAIAHIFISAPVIRGIVLRNR